MTVDAGLELPGRRHRGRIEQPHHPCVGSDRGEHVLEQKLVGVRCVCGLRNVEDRERLGQIDGLERRQRELPADRMQ